MRYKLDNAVELPCCKWFGFILTYRLDDLKGRFIDNVNFVSIRNLSGIDDRTLYFM